MQLITSKFKPVLPAAITFLLLLVAGIAFGQQGDNEAGRIEKKKIPITGSERFDVMFGRGVLIPMDRDLIDTVPYDPARSGSFSLGASFNFPFGKVFAIRLEPRGTWQKLHYLDDPNKTFPTDSGNVYAFEKHRSFYPEVGIGFKFNLYRDEEEKVKLFTEIGGSFGYNTGGTYKRRSSYTTSNGTVTNRTEKIHHVDDFEQLRYGLYFRAGTNWGAFQIFYRASDIFDLSKQYNHPDRGNVPVSYPKIPPIEVGIVFLI